MSSVRARSLLGSTGAMLEFASPDAPRARAVVLHGFTQSRWSLVRPLWPVLAQLGRTTRFLDAPGHGQNRGPTSLQGFLEGVAAMEPDLVVGYSMGGRLALWLCAQVPSLETTVVAISANPGILDPTSRAARRDRDEQLAARLEHLQPARGIDTDDTEVRGFLRAWDAQPLFAARRLGEAELRDRAAGDPRGWAWALRTYGTGAQPDLVPALAASRARLHLVVGGADSAYRAHAERLHGRARRVVIPGAGHDVPAEAPDLLAGAILGLLAN